MSKNLHTELSQTPLGPDVLEPMPHYKHADRPRQPCIGRILARQQTGNIGTPLLINAVQIRQRLTIEPIRYVIILHNFAALLDGNNGIEMKRRSHCFVTLAVVVLWTAVNLSNTKAATKLQVVTTIMPVHSLVAAVMQGAGEPSLLIKAANSPHNYRLRPSDARLLSTANVVFWIGKDIEISLVKPLETLSGSARVVALSKNKNLNLLKTREGGLWERDQDEPEQPREKQEIRDSFDTHFWLNPENAKIMVAEIVRQLSAADKQHANLFAKNSAKLNAELDQLVFELDRTLEPIRAKPYIVFHDAYQYFEKRFNLNAIGSITINPEQAPGARRLSDIRTKILETNTVCVFSEPQFKPAVIKTIIGNTPAKQAVLDPLGADITPGPQAYFKLIRAMARSLLSCLGTVN